MEKSSNHTWDLEKRSTDFAKQVIHLCKILPRNSMNDRLIGQIVGSSGSMGANYREANDALGKKDFQNRVKISRKETKETLHWLELIEEANPQCSLECKKLTQEATELRNIFSAIINKTKDQ